MTKAEVEWVCTDIDSNQYRRQISDVEWEFKEDRIINPVTKETMEYKTTINLDDYSWFEIIDACESFGYDAKRVDDWLTCGEELDLIAECLFELDEDAWIK